MDEAFWEITEDLRRSEADERYTEAQIGRAHV